MTTARLVSTALRRGLIPSDQATFTCCDIHDMLNEELSIHVIPVVLRLHEEYYVVDEDTAVCACEVRYKIPYRSIGNKLRDVQYVHTDGTHYEMTRVLIEDRPSCLDSNYRDKFLKYYMDSDNIVLMDKQNSGGNLRFSYYLRPNELVKNNRAGVISAIATCSCAGTTTYTVSCFPSHFTCTTTFDLVQAKSPNKILVFDIDKTASCATSKTITFTTNTITQVDICSTCTKAVTVAVGDYVMKAEETIVPQLPTELHALLAQRVTVKLLEALGDTEGMQNAQKELERMEFNAGTIIDNRSEGSPQKIVNRHSILKDGLFKITR
jgi:hypothetical protein